MQLKLLSRLASNIDNASDIARQKRLPAQLAGIMRAGTLLRNNDAEQQHEAAVSASEVAFHMIAQHSAFGMQTSTYAEPARKLATAGVFVSAVCLAQHGTLEVSHLFSSLCTSAC